MDFLSGVWGAKRELQGKGLRLPDIDSKWPGQAASWIWGGRWPCQGLDQAGLQPLEAREANRSGTMSDLGVQICLPGQVCS